MIVYSQRYIYLVSCYRIGVVDPAIEVAVRSPPVPDDSPRHPQLVSRT